MTTMNETVEDNVVTLTMDPEHFVTLVFFVGEAVNRYVATGQISLENDKNITRLLAALERACKKYEDANTDIDALGIAVAKSILL